MDHRPFEDWLLADEPLTPRQKRELQAHLQSCSDCAGLAEVNLALKSAKPVSPQAGFTDRFQVRLVAQKKALRRRNILGFLFLSLSVLGMAAWLAWPVFQAAIQSPVDLLASWLSSLVTLWASLQALEQISSVLLRTVTGFIPAYFWLAVLAAGVGWSLLWAFSLKRFAKIPQGA